MRGMIFIHPSWKYLNIDNKNVPMKTPTIDADHNVRRFEEGGMRLEAFDVFVIGVGHSGLIDG